MRALWIAAGVAVWALHFAVAYGFTALACARGWEGAVWPVVVAATVVSLAALGAMAWRLRPRLPQFEAWLALAVAGLAAIAIAYETVPLFLVPPCA